MMGMQTIAVASSNSKLDVRAKLEDDHIIKYEQVDTSKAFA